MLWSRSKKNKIKFSVKLDIKVNYSELKRIRNAFDYLDNAESLNDQIMTNAWLEQNNVTFSTGVLFTFNYNKELLVFSGSNGSIFNESNFEIDFPSKITRGTNIIIKATQEGGFFIFSFNDVPLMGVPVDYIVNLIFGNPLVEHHSGVKNEYGVSAYDIINLSPNLGGYQIPIRSTLAKEWFKFENKAIKITTDRVNLSDVLPMRLN